jgi:signal transduction histidine kinase/ligand-binding sensor domain-containing protein
MPTQTKPTWLRSLVLVATAVAALSNAPGARSLERTTRLTQYAHRSWRTGDAGLMGTPQSIAQTRDGYIWVSTENGLYRFDGMRFSKWNPQAGESLPSASLWYLFGGRDGSLYVGTDRGLARITDGHVYTYPGSPRWPGPFVEDRDGVLWMGVSSTASDPSAICKVEGEGLRCFGAHEGFSCTRGFSNMASPDGYLWVGGTEGICRWKPGNQPQAELLPSLLRRKGLSRVTGLAAVADGELWAGLNLKGSGAGLLHLENGRWRSYVTPTIDGSNLSISLLLAERNGSLWIGTTDKGVYRLAGGRLDHFDTADGLSDRHILSMLQDHEGGIWIVTPKGIDHFRDYAVLSFTASEDSLVDHASAVAADREGSVFLGSSILTRVNGQSLMQMKDKRGRLIKDVQFLFTDSHDNLWIGASNRLLVSRDHHEVSEVSGLPSSEGKYVVYITEDSAHDIWASLEALNSRSAQLIQIRNDRVVNRFDESSVVDHQVMNALAANPAGGLWVGGGVHGLFWFHDGHFQQISPGGFNERVENLLQEPDGALWIVTQRGFVRYFDGTAKRLTVASGLPCDSGVNIQDDEHGSKWLYTHCGIVRVSDADLAAWWESPDALVHGRLFDALEGARPNLSNGTPAQAADGRLWSASDYDFQVIDPQHLPFNRMPPPVKVERLAADGHDLTLDPKQEMPLHTRQIEIDYAALSFVIPERVHFKYRLEGHDSNWAEAGRRRQAFYNDLAPGHYVFHVTACNNDGVCNWRGTELAFTIPPAWYETSWFRALAALLVVILGTLAYVYRLQSYARLLKQRFDERLQERTRLARDLHDTLLQTIQGSKIVADEAKDHVEDPRMTGRSLDRLSEWLDRASVEGRAALEALRSSSIESNDLVGALHRVVDDCTPGARMTVNISTLGSVREMHPIARDEVYRIAHEAIRNACVHSGGKNVWIELQYKRRFHLKVRDNGHGVDDEVLRSGKPGHFGLAGMRERALFMGGNLHIGSSPYSGTVVSIVIPGQAIYKYPSRGIRAWLVDVLRSKPSPEI